MSDLHKNNHAANHVLQNIYANNIHPSIFDDKRHHEDCLIGDPNGEPYAVFVASKNYIPISVVIYAASEHDAKTRVTNAVQTIYDSYSEGHSDYERAKRILTIIHDGHIHAQPADKRFLFKAPWASNDRLI